MTHRLLNLFRRDRDVEDLARLVVAQRRLLQIKDEEIARLNISYTRWGRDLMEIMRDISDDDTLRDALDEQISEVRDAIALLEEHA